jgi:carboxypeptidase Taq
MLLELRRRLREISDLRAAGDLLSWDQATYMPDGGAIGQVLKNSTLFGFPMSLH